MLLDHGSIFVTSCQKRMALNAVDARSRELCQAFSDIVALKDENASLKVYLRSTYTTIGLSDQMRLHDRAACTLCALASEYPCLSNLPKHRTFAVE
jgi:hypothetical protein